ncbi:winged helix-turn-helix transcriptional regulator [Aquibacillus koreensis]|uniref:Winged helix-turn-helix transcriptional regulator n=1 Tax=Aquibacillus koreensis TaxID=279446 RepID=A0A9X3WL39_9BACI|nr:winged helix-turn-helix transcriptional regulator [Aquibacillus koreensis]MCT2538233.1 winged helix-turn-helix transcriptional regulator [Aquibacillus koreensis]MDC3420823.1 winged helix-turn-helix transcriptional regulator [Aquibacillus koreensis]
MKELCPRFEKAMQLFSKRWVGLILFELLEGSKRFSEMESELPVSGRLLSERLKMLEKEEIIERRVYSEFPVRIEYILTDKGRALEPVIKEIQTWSEGWITEQELEDENTKP